MSGKRLAKVAGYVTDIVSQLPETIEAITGFNFMDVIQHKTERETVEKQELEDSIE